MKHTLAGHSTIRILVVEDNKQNRELLVRVLHRWGYADVECMGDPRDFMEKFRQNRPDLVFLDCHMPYLSGPELLDLMRREPGWLDRTRVIMLTGDSGPTLEDEVLDLGASAIVTKPYVLNHLHEVIDRLVAELRPGEATG